MKTVWSQLLTLPLANRDPVIMCPYYKTSWQMIEQFNKIHSEAILKIAYPVLMYNNHTTLLLLYD